MKQKAAGAYNRGIRGDSIKTRIETSDASDLHERQSPALEEIPLKQGLKPQCFSPVEKLCEALEEIPLKQGLKLLEYANMNALATALEEIPLKQGLKQACERRPYPASGGIRGDSIKTRIETRRKSHF